MKKISSLYTRLNTSCTNLALNDFGRLRISCVLLHQIGNKVFERLHQLRRAHCDDKMCLVISAKHCNYALVKSTDSD